MEEDEGYDLQNGKMHKERKTEIIKSLSNLIPPFLESKHIKELSNFTNASEGKFIIQ